MFCFLYRKQSKPTGGSYTSPVPSEWSDGIPTGTQILWASSRIFTYNGESPQQAAWSEPSQMTDTATFEVRYSTAETQPSDPTTDSSAWSATANANAVWMAIRTCTNGTWTGWTITRIKGEKGDTGRSPALVYRGLYDSTKTYYGNANRIDCVKHTDGLYYAARVDAPDGITGFSGKLPTNAAYWNPFGDSFESVATSLLLAENANIADLIFKNGTLISMEGTLGGVYSTDYTDENFVPNIIIDGSAGVIKSSSGAKIDTNGVSLYDKDGNLLCSLTSNNIGEAADLNDKSYSGTRSISKSQQIYLPASNVVFEVTQGYMSYDIGSLSEDDVVKISSGKLTCTLPAHGTSGKTITYQEIDLHIRLMRDGKPVWTGSAHTEGAQSGEQVPLEISPGATFNITASGDYQPGRYSVEIYLVIACSGSSSGASATYTVAGNLAYSYTKAHIEKTLIGSDGMYSCWGEKKYLYTSAKGIFMRQGNYLFEITNSGIKYSTDGGTSTKSLT